MPSQLNKPTSKPTRRQVEETNIHTINQTSEHTNKQTELKQVVCEIDKRTANTNR